MPFMKEEPWEETTMEDKIMEITRNRRKLILKFTSIILRMRMILI